MIADSHRFGAQVRLIHKEDGRSWYEKPRSTTLENYFLGNQSISLFSSIFKCDSPFYFEQVSEFFSYSLCIDQYMISDLDLIEMSEFSDRIGELLAYCTYYGIGDLHKDNIKIISVQDKILPVPVDIENCLIDFISCSETLLIPSNLVNENCAGISGQFGKGVVSKVIPENILDRFILTFSMMMKKEDRLFINANDLCNIKIRVILRDTAVYYDLLSGRIKPSDLKIPLIQEEILQLSNRDIPYFFTTKNSRKLYYFKSSVDFEEADPKHFQLKLDRYSIPVNSFFSSDRMEKLFQQSTTHFVRLMGKYFKKDRGNHFIIKKSEGNAFYLETDQFVTKGTF